MNTKNKQEFIKSPLKSFDLWDSAQNDFLHGQTLGGIPRQGRRVQVGKTDIAFSNP